MTFSYFATLPWRTAPLLLACAWLGACSGGLRSSEPEIVSYVLQAPRDVGVAADTAAAGSAAATAVARKSPGYTLIVLEPIVAPGLERGAGSDRQGEGIRASLKYAVDERLSEAAVDKVIRNVASSWEQAGLLVGRTFKKRALVRATPGSVAFGLYLGHAVGFRGASLFATGWVSLLDCTPVAARDLAVEAKRIGLIDLRIAGDVVDLALDRLDPAEGRS